jgi:predicted permease
MASFAMAKEMGADVDTAGLLVVMTTVLSIFTMSFWIALTRGLHIW